MQQTLSHSLVDLLLSSANSLDGVLAGLDGDVGLLDLSLQSGTVSLVTSSLNSDNLNALLTLDDIKLSTL